MSLHGFARARDLNEGEIVAALEAVGCSVTRLSSKGVPDLLVGFHGRTKLIEVKRPDKKPTLTEDQVRWLREWRGEYPAIAQTVEHALRAIGLHIRQPGLYTYCVVCPDVCDGSDMGCVFAPRHLIGTYTRKESKR